MKAVFIHDTYYSRAPGGAVYAFGNFPHSLWQERFLPHFHALTIIGREKPFEPSHALNAIRSDGPGVRFVLLPNISTPIARIFGSAPATNQIREEVGRANALILRGPSEFGMIAAREAKIVKLTSVNAAHTIPVAVEMSGCAFDHTWHHGSPTGKLYAPVKYLRARHMVKNADHVIYVTKEFLQRRYPASPKSSGETIANASNVEIISPPSSLLLQKLSKIENRETIVFGLIGNYGNKLKGIDVAINALARLRPQLPSFELRILGHGPPAPHKDFVKFHEPLNNPADILAWLDDVDIYLQPSRHEGLPRALIEAMSRGCPVLASNAGGIPELLDKECIHRKGNIRQLSIQILNALNPEWRKRQATRNFELAKEYSRDVLLPRRDQFWTSFAALAARRKSEFSREPQQENILAEI